MGDGLIHHAFDVRVLLSLVQSEVFDLSLSNPDLKTGLVIMTKCIDTGSVWPVVNNPFGPYFHGRSGIGKALPRKGNSDYRLLDLIRASIAAPSSFSPMDIGIIEGEKD